MKVYLLKHMSYDIYNPQDTTCDVRVFQSLEAAEKAMHKIYVDHELKRIGIERSSVHIESLNSLMALGLTELSSYALISTSPVSLMDTTLDTKVKKHVASWKYRKFSMSLFVNPDQGRVWTRHSTWTADKSYGDEDPEDFQEHLRSALLDLRKIEGCDSILRFYFISEYLYDEDDEIVEDHAGLTVYPYEIEEAEIED